MKRILRTAIFILGYFAPQQNVVSGLSQLPGGVLVESASETFERPCSSSDLACIQRYFLHHSKCWPAPGWVSDPFYRGIARGSYSSDNIELTSAHTFYRGLNNGKIKDFYLNRHTDKLVITVELRDYRRLDNDSFYAYYRKGQEPLVTHGYTKVYSNSVFVTMIIPHLDDLQLNAFDAFAYSDIPPVFDIDPKLGQSSDPSIPARFTAFLSKPNLPVVVKEFWNSESAFLAAIYIQNVICDFGLHIS